VAEMAVVIEVEFEFEVEVVLLPPQLSGKPAVRRIKGKLTIFHGNKNIWFSSSLLTYFSLLPLLV